MASSKNKLTEEQLVEGILTKILQSILSRRTSKALDAIVNNNPALDRATKEFQSASRNMDKALRKRANIAKRNKKKFGR
jgi:hypothetical protein